MGTVAGQVRIFLDLASVTRKLVAHNALYRLPRVAEQITRNEDRTAHIVRLQLALANRIVGVGGRGHNFSTPAKGVHQRVA